MQYFYSPVKLCKVPLMKTTKVLVSKSSSFIRQTLVLKDPLKVKKCTCCT